MCQQPSDLGRLISLLSRSMWLFDHTFRKVIEGERREREDVGLADASVVKSSGSRLPTRHEHAREIAGVVGYRDFSAAKVELWAWLEARL